MEIVSLFISNLNMMNYGRKQIYADSLILKPSQTIIWKS